MYIYALLPRPLSAQEFTELWPVLDLVVDGGRVSDSEGDSSRRGSTVVDLSQAGKFSVIREGRLVHHCETH